MFEIRAFSNISHACTVYVKFYIPVNWREAEGGWWVKMWKMVIKEGRKQGGK